MTVGTCQPDLLPLPLLWPHFHLSPQPRQPLSYRVRSSSTMDIYALCVDMRSSCLAK